MGSGKRFSRIVAMILLLTFFVWQVDPYAFAVGTESLPLDQQWIAPENNPQTRTMTPEIETDPDDIEYIAGYRPSDYEDGISQDDGDTPFSLQDEDLPPNTGGFENSDADAAMEGDLRGAMDAEETEEPVMPVISQDGTVTERFESVSWDAVAGATGYEVQVSRNADFSELILLNQNIVSTSQFELPDFSAGQYYIRVRALQGTGEEQTAMTGWSGARQFTMNVTYPTLMTPLSYAQGGVDANILDWSGSAAGYRVYRRVFGTTEWILAGDVGSSIRFFDTNIDSAVAYQYQVRAYTAGGAETVVDFQRSANYDAAYQSSIQPQNVLVLINTNALGYVDIGESVEDADAAHGHLDPISESDLLRYLGREASSWQDADHDGVAYILDADGNVLARKDAQGKIEVPLGIYYAIRREVPKENICFIQMPVEERVTMLETNFLNSVVNPIHDFMVSRNLTSQITSIVSAYHFPISAMGQSWETALASKLEQSFFGTTTSGNTFDLGRHFSRLLGDTAFFATRLDAQDAQTVRTNMIDNAIYAEQNFLHAGADWIRNFGLTAFVDWDGPYDQGDGWFLGAADILRDSGLFGNQGENWDMNSDMLAYYLRNHPQYDQDQDGRLDDTFLFTGWYHYAKYQDYYNWARGAIGWDLDSASGGSFRSWTETYTTPGFLLSDFSNLPDGISNLFQVIQAHGYSGLNLEGGPTLASLNALLEIPNFYQLWMNNANIDNSLKWNLTSHLSYGAEIRKLIDETASYRNLMFDQMTLEQQAKIRGLNRLLLAVTYPTQAPVTLWNFWGANIINRGAAASLGAVGEPGLAGHTRPHHFLNYLLQGYSFAESGYFAGGFRMMAFDGDPLYRPFSSNAQSGSLRQQVLVNGEVLTRVILQEESFAEDRGGYSNGIWRFSAFRDYDSSGRLVREQTSGGVLFTYNRDGSVLVYDMKKYGQSSTSVTNREGILSIYDAGGRLIKQSAIPGVASDWSHDEIECLPDGSFRIHRYYADSERIDIFDQNGLLLELDPETGSVVGAKLVKVFITRYENRSLYEPIRYATSYEVIGLAILQAHSVNSVTYPVISEVRKDDGSSFIFSYADDSFEISTVVYRNDAGQVLATGQYDQAAGTVNFVDSASGVVWSMPAGSDLAQFLSMLAVIPAFTVRMNFFRDQLIHYLMTWEGLTREQILSQISFHNLSLLNSNILRESYLPTFYRITGAAYITYGFEHGLPGPTNRIRITKSTGVSGWYLIGLINCNQQWQITSELRKAEGEIPERLYDYGYDGSGNFMGYRESVKEDGQFVERGFYLWSETTRSFRLVIGNERVVYVGYPDQGFNSYAGALQYLQAFQAFQIQSRVTFDIAAPLLAVPGAFPGGAPFTLDLPWLEGATGIEIEIAEDEGFSEVVYRTTVLDPGVQLNLAAGSYFLRARYIVGETFYSNWANAVFAVNPAANQPPVAVAPTIPAFNEDTSRSITLGGTDADNNSLIYIIVSGPSHGTLVRDTANFPNDPSKYIYTPNANYNGADSFTYKVNDGTEDSQVVTVSLTVNAVNDAPVVLAALLTGNEDSILTGSVTGTDVDGNPLTYRVVGTVPQGLVFNTNGSFSYQPAANFNGTVTFDYVASDGITDSVAARVTMNINPANDIPVANAQSVTTDEDAPKAFTLIGTDVDSGQTLTYSIVTQPLHGAVTCNGASCTYTPAANYNGTDTLTFRVFDGTAYSAPATVSIIVSAVNDAPVATLTVLTGVTEDTARTFNLTGTDIEGSTLTYAITAQTAKGTLNCTPAGVCTYTPNANASGEDSFTYKVNDGTADSAPVTLHFTITAVNDAPVMNAIQSQTVTVGQELSLVLSGTDVEGNTLTYRILGALPQGASLNAQTGVFTWTPAQAGTTTLRFVVNDGQVDSAAQEVTIQANAGQLPVIQIVGTVPVLTNIPALTVNYTVDGVAQVATFNLQEGENSSLQVVVKDANQNVLAYYDLPTITLDTVAPVIVVTSSIPSITNQAQLVVHYTVDGVAQSRTFTLEEGDNELPALTAVDAAGNQAVLALGHVVLDRAAPVIVVSSVIPALTNQPVLTVTYTVDGGSVQTMTFTLQEGNNEGLVITAEDALGNEATYALPAIRLDTVAPVIVVTSSIPSITNQAQLVVHYTVDGVAQSRTFTLEEGDNELPALTAVDAAGNRSTHALPAVEYMLSDPEEPGIIVVGEVPTITNQNQITINYTVDGAARAQSFQLLTEGLNQIVLRDQDHDGNPIERTFSITRDTVAPVVALAGDLPEVLTIPAVYVTYTVDGEIRMIVLPLEEGDNTDLQVTAMDAAGNEGVLHLPNVRYEKPPVVATENFSRNLGGGTDSGEDQRQVQRTPVSLADFRVYLQTRNMSLLQRSRVNRSLGLVSAGAFVYRYETSSGTQYSWTESTGRTVVFSFENNTLLFGELLTRILS